MRERVQWATTQNNLETCPYRKRHLASEQTANRVMFMPNPSVPRLVWSGDVPHQKWMNFYTKVLSKFAATAGLKLTLRVEVAPAEGVSSQKVDETKVALRELGLKDSLET
jgi:hypothetical protein